MMMTELPILSLVIWAPILGGVWVLIAGDRQEETVKYLALGVSVITFILSCFLYTDFAPDTHEMQFVEFSAWIEPFSIYYHLGVDGIAVPLIVLTTFTTVLVVLAGWEVIEKRLAQYMAAFLILEGLMNGVFAALDAILFYVFWEIMIVPMFLLIGVWGGAGRIHAAIKFLLFTLAGSLIMLVGLVGLLHASGTLDFQALNTAKLNRELQAWLFVAFTAAFAVKVPMFPVHTWLPDAHTEAPTAGSVILAGILLKMGGYGLLRVALPILPDAVQLFLKPMLALSAVAIVYGAYVTLAQTDVKRLIAYSSISHMGFVTLGIFTLNRTGVEGAILQMINHGIITGALFLCIGMIYERTHTREIADYGGLSRAAPVYSTFLALFCLAAAGFPGLNAFVGEFLIIGGAFRVWVWLGAMAIFGVVLGTTYLLWLYYRVAMGEQRPELQGQRLELNAREVLTLAPLALFVLLIGLYPDSVLGFLRVSVAQLLSGV